VLPVLSLEQYFGLQEEPSRSEGYKYVVTKTPVGEDTIARTILRFSHPIRIRKLIFNATEARHTGLLVNSGDILGAFTLPENQLLIVPDVAKIHQNVR
jgi:chemotaxis signal transduction protein